MLFLKNGDRNGDEMSQQIKVLAIKPDNLRVTPRTHMVDEKNRLLEADI